MLGFDPTIHVGDLLSLSAMVWAVSVKVRSALERIEQFMSESREDRMTLHRRLEEIERKVNGR